MDVLRLHLHVLCHSLHTEVSGPQTLPRYLFGTSERQTNAVSILELES